MTPAESIEHPILIMVINTHTHHDGVVIVQDYVVDCLISLFLPSFLLRKLPLAKHSLYDSPTFGDCL